MTHAWNNVSLTTMLANSPPVANTAAAVVVVDSVVAVAGVVDNDVDKTHSAL